MAVAGVAWGAYSLLGRGSPAALLSTADNFVKSIVFVPLLAWIIAVDHLKLTLPGTVLALISGAVTSGLGYAIWYRALGGLPPTRAALLQLCVPVLAALGGVLLLGETISLRLALCSALILFGVALAIV